MTSHLCVRVMKGRLYESWVRDHVGVIIVGARSITVLLWQNVIIIRPVATGN